MVTNTKLVVTNHALKRMKERCGLNHKASIRMAHKAYEDGISHKDLFGSIMRWVDGLYLSQEKANNVRIYGEFAYLFSNQTLVTVVRVPKKLISSLNFVREEIKNGNNML